MEDFIDMKRVEYIINFPTNIPEDSVEKVVADIKDQILRYISNTPYWEEVCTDAVGDVCIVSIDNQEVDFNDFGDIQFFAYLICNDNVEKIGIADAIYQKMEKELRDLIEGIQGEKIYVGQGLHENPDGNFLRIDISDLDTDYLDGMIDKIEDYEQE